MAVFPERMDRLSSEDMPGSLNTLENYIRYMGDRVEFSMRNVTKSVSAAGVSSAELYLRLTAVQNAVSTLSSTVNGMAGDMTAVKSELGDVKSKITAAEQAIAELKQQMAGVNNSISGMQAQITAMDGRITKLEEEKGGTTTDGN